MEQATCQMDNCGAKRDIVDMELVDGSTDGYLCKVGTPCGPVWEVRSNGNRFYHVRAGSSEGAILIVNGFHLRADWFANEIVPNHVAFTSVLGR